MQRSETPTDFVIVKAETTSEWDICNFALVPLSTLIRQTFGIRSSIATIYKDDEAFVHSVYQDIERNVVSFYGDENDGDETEDNPVLDMLGEDNWMFVNITEEDIKCLRTPSSELGNCYSFFSKEGAVYFIAYNDSREEWETNGIRVEDLIKPLTSADINSMDTLIATTIEEIKDEVTRRGTFTLSTCDTWSYGWNRDKHNAMHTIQRRGIDGYHITHKMSHEVTDWTVTKL